MLSRLHPITLAAFDRKLVVGQEIEARFTRSGETFAVPAIISKLNAATIKAYAINSVRGWYVFTLQRYNVRGTANNCAAPRPTVEG
jgi:hypothetical protein